MRAAILILKRSISMPKAVWRSPSTKRTLAPLTMEGLVDKSLQGWSARSPVAQLIIEADVAQDGSDLKAAVPRAALDKDWSGVFALNMVGAQVRLSLTQEACHREVRAPRRSTQFLTCLQPWEPIRVILNGKADDGSSHRHYYLQDYHVVLCQGARPKGLQPVRTFDFQADLI